jgi:hypothetical protein
VTSIKRIVSACLAGAGGLLFVGGGLVSSEWVSAIGGIALVGAWGLVFKS